MRREEKITRSAATGDFVFTPPGIHALLIEAGITDIERQDVTETMTLVAQGGMPRANSTVTISTGP